MAILPPPLVAVNGRFADRPVTGVERYAGELVARLPEALGGPVAILRPDRALAGVSGHAWEQLRLPGAFRRSGSDVLASLCNVGPVAVRSQLVVVHDVAPFRLPGSFSAAYRTQVRLLQRLLASRCAVATVSEHSRRELADVLSLDPATIALVPPAVGPPFAPGGTRAEPRRCVLVGGHDERKNARFLLDLWGEVHDRTGLELHVTARPGSATLSAGGGRSARGVVWHDDLDDAGLLALYRSAHLVLSPSRYEGFGLPLLEGMACGTPFLATATGAAEELAVDPAQLLPLDREAWIARLGQWADADLSRLRDASLAAARPRTWDRSARSLADALMAVARPATPVATR